METLTQGRDSTALVDDTDSCLVVDSLVVRLDTPAPSIVTIAVGDLGGGIAQAVERALGEVVSSVLGSNKLSGESSEGQDSGLHFEGWFVEIR